jgi:ABC-type polysaccharide/polyol phosphate export permease
MAITPDMHLSIVSIAVIILCCITYSLLGVVAGMIANSHLTLTLFTTLVITPMTFLSGTIFSLDALPEFAQWILNALPLSHSTDCIRSAILGTDFPLISLGVIFIYMVAFVLISRHILMKGRN